MGAYLTQPDTEEEAGSPKPHPPTSSTRAAPITRTVSTTTSTAAKNSAGGVSAAKSKSNALRRSSQKSASALQQPARVDLTLMSAHTSTLTDDLSVRVEVPLDTLRRAGPHPVWRVYVELDIAHLRRRRLLIDAHPAPAGVHTVCITADDWNQALINQSGHNLCNIAAVFFRLCDQDKPPLATSKTPTDEHDVDYDDDDVDVDNAEGDGTVRGTRMDLDDGDEDDGCVAVADLVMDIFYDVRSEVPPSDPSALSRRVFGLQSDGTMPIVHAAC